MRKRTKKLRKKKVKRGGSSSTYTRSNTFQMKEAERQKREIAMAEALEFQMKEAERQKREIELAKLRSRGSKTRTYTAGIRNRRKASKRM